MSLSTIQLEHLVARLVNSHRKAPINWFIDRRRGQTKDELIRQGRIAKSTGLLDTQIHHPWDRRRDESARQYEAFVYYRDLGSDRTFVDVSRDLNIGMSTVTQYKRLFQWAARVRAYDEREEKRLRKVAERARKEMVERQARVGQTMTDLAQAALDAEIILPETVADVVRLAEAGTRIERLARGESTENVSHGMSLVLAHPLPAWAPEAAKQLVVENEYEKGVTINADTIVEPDAGAKTEA